MMARFPKRRRRPSISNSEGDTDAVDDPQSEVDSNSYASAVTSTSDSEFENNERRNQNEIPPKKQLRQTTLSLAFTRAKSTQASIVYDTSQIEASSSSVNPSVPLPSHSEVEVVTLLPSSTNAAPTRTSSLDLTEGGISSSVNLTRVPSSSNLNLSNQKLSVIPCKKARKKSSIIWKFYEECKVDSRLNVCTICGQKTPNTNTTNCLDHIKRDHLSAYNKVKEEMSKGKELMDINFEPTNLDSGKEQKSTKKTTYRSSLKRQRVTYGKKNVKKIKLDRALVEMIATDYQPFSMVDDIGFQKLMYTADPRYVLPSANSISNKLLPNLYEEVSAKLKNTVETLAFPYMSLTFDGWTAKSKEGYLGVTGHFIDNNQFRAVHLKMISLDDKPHTAVNLSKLLQDEVLSMYPNIQYVCAVTDSAANMIATAKELKMKHMPCFAHKLQTVINRAILAMAKEDTTTNDTNNNKSDDEDLDFDEVEKILKLDQDGDGSNAEGVSFKSVIKKCKRITQFFNQSTTSHAMLTKELKKQRAAITSLKQENNTRWNSTYNMLNSIQKAADAITLVLPKIKKHNITPISSDESDLLLDILLSLDHFLAATQNLNGETYVSISCVIPTVTILLEDLTKMIEGTNKDKPELKTALGKTFALKLLELSKQYLLIYETRSTTAFATILDPRIKEHGFSSLRNYESHLVGLKEELKLKFQAPQQNKQKEMPEMSKSNHVNKKPKN